jgi:anti-sigma regulatory factor (Ser/Thr protein kinase)
VSPVLRLRLPLTRPAARRLRAASSAHLAAHGIPPEIAGEVLLAADEAFVNAFMHSGDVAGAVEVRVEVGDEHILVEIRDRGCGFDVGAFDAGSVPDPLVSHGRGLFLIHHLMDQVEVRSHESEPGTLVRMVKRLSHRPLRIVESPG